MAVPVRKGGFAINCREVAIFGTNRTCKFHVIGTYTRVHNEHRHSRGILLGHEIVKRKRALIDAIEPPGCRCHRCGANDTGLSTAAAAAASGGRRQRRWLESIHHLIFLDRHNGGTVAQGRQCRLGVNLPLGYRQRQRAAVEYHAIHVIDGGPGGLGQCRTTLGRADGIVGKGDEIGLLVAGGSKIAVMVRLLHDIILLDKDCGSNVLLRCRCREDEDGQGGKELGKEAGNGGDHDDVVAGAAAIAAAIAADDDVCSSCN